MLTPEIAPVGSHTVTQEYEMLAERAFAAGPDAELADWFSFAEMRRSLTAGDGICVAATAGPTLLGFVYAQPENPINGREGREKWVIVLAAVDPDQAGAGIGAQLLAVVERQVARRAARKLFVYTNQGDERALRFYRRNGYEDAGWIRDYQYGHGNSAVFLLKHLTAEG